jgi:hypothetical protein
MLSRDWSKLGDDGYRGNILRVDGKYVYVVNFFFSYY